MGVIFKIVLIVECLDLHFIVELNWCDLGLLFKKITILKIKKYRYSVDGQSAIYGVEDLLFEE
jgi:hypothetical protein